MGKIKRLGDYWDSWERRRLGVTPPGRRVSSIASLAPVSFADRGQRGRGRRTYRALYPGRRALSARLPWAGMFRAFSASAASRQKMPSRPNTALRAEFGYLISRTDRTDRSDRLSCYRGRIGRIGRIGPIVDLIGLIGLIGPIRPMISPKISLIAVLSFAAEVVFGWDDGFVVEGVWLSGEIGDDGDAVGEACLLDHAVWAKPCE